MLNDTKRMHTRGNIEIPQGNPSLNYLYERYPYMPLAEDYIEVTMNYKMNGSDTIFDETIKVSNMESATRQGKELIKYYNDGIPVFGGAPRTFLNIKEIIKRPQITNYEIKELDSSLFEYRNHEMYSSVMKKDIKDICKDNLLGWCEATSLASRPKDKTYVALMVWDDEHEEEIWFHWDKKDLFKELGIEEE